MASNLKRKHADATREMSEQIDQLQKMKSKIDKDKNHIIHEIADARAATDEVIRSQASSDKSNKTLQATLNDISKKLGEANLTLGDMDAAKRKIAVENGDMLRVVGDLDNNLNILTKLRSSLAGQLNEVKAMADNEARERALLRGKFVNLEHELDGAREAFDEESSDRDNVLRQVAKCESDSAHWRQKYDRQRRTLEQDLADTNETLAELSNQNQAIASSKRKLESELNTLQADLDEMGSEARMSEEKAARAMIDAARLADELRAEQDVSADLEKAKRLLEAQCKDAQARADEAEMNALKGGKKAMLKMESRIHELESELDAESRRLADGMKSLRKSERRIKELTFSSDEDKKNHERMQALIDTLQGKIKSYKKQIEEAEEIAALNLAKYRKVAGALGDAEASADLNEVAFARFKARERSASLGPI